MIRVTKIYWDEQFIETLRQNFAITAKANNEKFERERIERDIKHYESLRNTEGINLEKLDKLISSLTEQATK